MSLEDKRILIFAAYGAISREVAAQAVMQRAEVFLSGRDPVQLAALKSELQGLGGRVHTDVVDASEADAVRTYIDRVVSTGRIDATFNGIGLRAAAAAYGTPSPKLALAKFLLPLEVHVGSSFLTSSIVGEAMSKMGGGSIERQRIEI